MASLGSSIRSAARATYSAYRRVPVRWRLAGGSAALTLVILASFAAIVGVLTNRQVRTQFNDSQSAAIGRIGQEIGPTLSFKGQYLDLQNALSLSEFASGDRAQIRIFDDSDGILLATQDEYAQEHFKISAPDGLFATSPSQNSGYFVQSGYRVAVKQLNVKPLG